MRLDRVETRAKVTPRRDPYWQRLTKGRYIGFRRMSRGAAGTWLARCYDGEQYQYRPLGDFASLPEKERFDAAKAVADDWFDHLDLGGAVKRGTVKGACEAYVDHLRLNNSVAAADDAAARFGRLIYADPIAKHDLTKLSPRNVADWKKRVLTVGGS